MVVDAWAVDKTMKMIAVEATPSNKRSLGSHYTQVEHYRSSPSVDNRSGKLLDKGRLEKGEPELGGRW
uniref:Uncharacterized protein n=1 Tax=Nelumbo nucifera TaxID=4432 RepID=A0A822ZDA4_NELNU|nr:TPA_asm: hypothetical protein HUJ06_015718 [Nelumbo nucifera]